MLTTTKRSTTVKISNCRQKNLIILPISYNNADFVLHERLSVQLIGLEMKLARQRE